MDKGKSSAGIYFTADTHFGHTNIIKYCNRPFTFISTASIGYHDRDIIYRTDLMDQTLIDNINTTVGINDTLWHLGDFSFSNVQDYLRRINCRNVNLIVGNHDKYKIEDYYAFGFRKVLRYAEIKIQNISITLNHYSQRVWNKSHHGAYHLYGHSHGTLPPFGKSMDVGVDTNNYFPYSWEEIQEILSKREISEVDHHVSTKF